MAARPDEQAPEPTPATAQSVEELALLLRKLRRREARRREGAELTYRELATKAGWSHAVVSAYFTGKILPPTDRFDALVRLLGATPSEQGALATARDRIEEGRRRSPPSTGTCDSAAPRAPQQLPTDVIGFVGRESPLAVLDELLDLGGRVSAVVICVVSGMAGVGKTALTVHWAHRVKHRFPDGQLFADLRGYGAGPAVEPEQVLDRFLIGLGVTASDVPNDPAAKAALYRSLLSERRTLVVLDNAATPQQVRPLVPGSPGCLVVVTSRRTLPGLAARDRARRIDLDVLSPQDAIILLEGFVGTDRIATEPDAAQHLVRLCGCLPIALCVAGERAAAQPDTALAGMVDGLTSGRMLDLLDADGDRDTAMRAIFSWSYDELPAAAAELFGLLALQPAHDLDVYAAAALAGTDVPHARRLIDLLLAVNLIRQRYPGRYDMHDLLRMYAIERALRHHAEPSRREALARLLDYYRNAASVASQTLFPVEPARPFIAPAASAPDPARPPTARARLEPDLTRPPTARARLEPDLTRPPTAPARLEPDLTRPPTARAWLETERPNLLAIANLAADGFWPAYACDLSSTLATHLYTGAHYADAQEIHSCAIRAAREMGDRRAEGWAMLHLGRTLLAIGRNGEGQLQCENALAAFHEAGDATGEGRTLRRLAVLHRVAGRYAQAGEHLDRALRIFGDLGDRLEQAHTLGALAETQTERGDHRQARDNLLRCLRLHRELGDRIGEAHALGALGYVNLEWGRYRQAIDYFRRSGQIFPETGDLRSEARGLNGLGTALLGARQAAEALNQFQSAMALARSIGDPHEEMAALTGAADALHATGQLEEARRCCVESLKICAAYDMPEPERLLRLLATLDNGNHADP